MYYRPLSSRIPALMAFLSIVALFGCTSRYRLELFQTSEETRKRVKIEKTEYIRDAVLTSPTSEEKVMPGRGNVIILTTGTRGERNQKAAYDILSYDEYLRSAIYIQLPALVKADTKHLALNSFLLILGRYDSPPEARLYRPNSGQMVIDSISGGRLYATIDALYRNGNQVPLKIDGQFRVKISK